MILHLRYMSKLKRQHAVYLRCKQQMSLVGFTGSKNSIWDIREKPPVSPRGVHMWLVALMHPRI